MISQSDALGRNLTLVKGALQKLGSFSSAALTAFTDAAQSDLNMRFAHEDRAQFEEFHLANREAETRLLATIKSAVLHQATADAKSDTPSAQFVETMNSLGGEETAALYNKLVQSMMEGREQQGPAESLHEAAAKEIVEQIMASGRLVGAIARAAEWEHVKATKPELISK